MCLKTIKITNFQQIFSKLNLIDIDFIVICLILKAKKMLKYIDFEFSGTF